MSACDKRNGAIGAETVAPLRNLDVGIVFRRGKCTFVATPVVALGLRFEVVYQVHKIELAVPFVHLGDFGFQFVQVALAQAAHYVQLAQFAVRLAVGKLENGIDTLLFGITDKSAGVDNGNLTFRVFRIVYTTIACQFQLVHQSLGIHKIFGAAQSDNIYFVFMQVVQLTINN